VAALFIKCLIGAVTVLIIALLSRTKVFFIAGLVPLFPTFALIAHYIVGTERSMEQLRLTALFGLWSLIPYAAYLGAVYVLNLRYSLTVTLTGAIGVWIVFAAIILLVWTRLYSA
jgi:membrane protein GlpM